MALLRLNELCGLDVNKDRVAATHSPAATARLVHILRIAKSLNQTKTAGHSLDLVGLIIPLQHQYFLNFYQDEDRDQVGQQVCLTRSINGTNIGTTADE